MIMALKPESLVRSILSEQLNIQFAKSCSQLGGWGRTDGEAQLGGGKLLLLEVESSQKHPSTNVLKVWPFLEANEDLSVLLVHAFFPDSPGLDSSRGELAAWLAQKLHDTLGTRFIYRRIIVSRDGQPLQGFAELMTAVR